MVEVMMLVVICFHFSIFEPLETTYRLVTGKEKGL